VVPSWGVFEGRDESPLAETGSTRQTLVPQLSKRAAVWVGYARMKPASSGYMCRSCLTDRPASLCWLSCKAGKPFLAPPWEEVHVFEWKAGKPFLPPTRAGWPSQGRDVFEWKGWPSHQAQLLWCRGIMAVCLTVDSGSNPGGSASFLFGYLQTEGPENQGSSTALFSFHR
jgi:hypothetical protein